MFSLLGSGAVNQNFGLGSQFWRSHELTEGSLLYVHNIEKGSPCQQLQKETIHSAEIDGTSYEWAARFHWDARFEKQFFLLRTLHLLDVKP